MNKFYLLNFNLLYFFHKDWDECVLMQYKYSRGIISRKKNDYKDENEELAIRNII